MIGIDLRECRGRHPGPYLTPSDNIAGAGKLNSVGGFAADDVLGRSPSRLARKTRQNENLGLGFDLVRAEKTSVLPSPVLFVFTLAWWSRSSLHFCRETFKRTSEPNPR
jgi:hypothetical protein